MTLLPPPFPIAIDQLSAELLGRAVGSPLSGFETTRIGADRGMLGEIFVIDLEYRDAPALDAPQRIVAKFAALREGSLSSARRARAHERELRFFDEILPLTPVNAPACYGTWYDPETAHFLLLQDAVDVDPSVDQVQGLTVDQAVILLDAVAPMHARWWNDSFVLDSEWLPKVDGEARVQNLTFLAQAGWDGLCDLIGEDLGRGERDLGAEYPARLEAALHTVAALPSTFVHSDLRADNLLFSPDGTSVTIVDWQGCGVGPPCFDLAYFISQSLTVDDRREHEVALLDHYRGRLAHAGCELTIDELRRGYAESMHYGLVIACAIPLIGDPAEPRVASLTRAVYRRAIEALRDHRQLW